jgi:hypothetical protein
VREGGGKVNSQDLSELISKAKKYKGETSEQLTKREQFAMAAMQALITRYSSNNHQNIADEAFRMSDAMLAESNNTD